MNNFENIIVSILDKIFPMGKKQNIEDLKDIKTKEEFNQYLQNNKPTIIANIHKGFKEAQLMIIENLLLIQKELHRECREIVRTLFYQYILIKNLLANAKKNGNYEKEFSLFMEKLTSEHSCPTGRNRNLFRLLFLLFSF